MRRIVYVAFAALRVYSLRSPVYSPAGPKPSKSAVDISQSRIKVSSRRHRKGVSAADTSRSPAPIVRWQTVFSLRSPVALQCPLAPCCALSRFFLLGEVRPAKRLEATARMADARISSKGLARVSTLATSQGGALDFDGPGFRLRSTSARPACKPSTSSNRSSSIRGRASWGCLPMAGIATAARLLLQREVHTKNVGHGSASDCRTTDRRPKTEDCGLVQR